MMKERKAALGKGLGALIPLATDINRTGRIAAGGNAAGASPTSRDIGQETSDERSQMMSVSEIPLDRIAPNPFQPRLTFDDEALAEMAESIKSLGLIQPLTVRNIGSHYQIISGERRFRASKLAGLTHVPAYVLTTDDKGMLEMAIVENIQREDLNAIEVALSYQRLIEECNLTQEEMANRIGKKRTSITNYLRLLKLPPSAQSALIKGLISVGHAKCLLSLDNENDEKKLCDETIAKGWSIRQLEEKIQKLAAVKTDKPEKRDSIQNMNGVRAKVVSAMKKYFSGKVSLKCSENGKGSITVYFKNDGEIEKFLNALNPDA